MVYAVPTLPVFAYHPDPVGTGAIVRSDASCENCGQCRGWIYSGPVFAVEEVDALCPWCVADGTAAEAFDAMFTDDWGAPEGVPAEIVGMVTRRTPGFRGWQQEHWLYHCSDGAEYLGRVGYDDVVTLPGVIGTIVADGWSDDAVRAMTADGELTGYLFRCRHCRAYLAYADAS